MTSNPFENAEPLIRRVYSFVAYRIGDGADAEDVTSTTIERALRYRKSFDARKGKPQTWLIGIARSCVDDYLRGKIHVVAEPAEEVARGELEKDTILRLTVGTAVAALNDLDRELIALRYGADLSARQIGQLLDMKPNAVGVALHRARERLRDELQSVGLEPSSGSAVPVRGATAETSF